MSVVGDRYIFLATGKETGGAFAAFEFHIPSGNGPPLHMHHRETEFFFVLDGEFEFYVGGQTLRRKAGESLLAPPEIAHRFTNVGATPGGFSAPRRRPGWTNFFASLAQNSPTPAPHRSRRRQPISSASWRSRRALNSKSFRQRRGIRGGRRRTPVLPRLVNAAARPQFLSQPSPA